MSEHEANTRGPVVAIGASAGGLEQISTLLGLLPDNTGAAFVVMQHLSAARKSQLPELLSRTTTLPVIVIEHDMALEPDRVHVMPENCALGIKNGRLQLLPKKEETTPTVIDGFMRALAEERTEKAIGIILSGSGNDGALGLKAIKLHGGLSMVQDPDTAEHPSMPRAAIAGATPDYVRETKALAEPLCNHLEHNLAAPHPIGEKDQHVEDEDENDNDFLHDVLGILRQYDKKRDFSAYKPNMLKRRIQRRMGLIGTGEPDAYRQLLQQDGAERENLSQDFLICVTDFFRDSEAYAALYDTALPTLLEKRDTEDSIRVWVPGCATGEEAYSIAMALDEAIHRTGRDYSFIVFASDVDQRALKVARAGFYPESIAADVSPSRLRAYFDKPDDHYRVKRRLRRVVFAAQNVIEDPPYSRLDLISCRNLLMYFKPETQKQEADHRDISFCA